MQPRFLPEVERMWTGEDVVPGMNKLVAVLHELDEVDCIQTSPCIYGHNRGDISIQY
jgi:hypothetical protein